MTGAVKPLLPKAREEGLAVEELDGEVLVYDLDRHKAHRLNGVAARVWRASDGTRTVSELGALAAPPSASSDTREKIAWSALKQLERQHLLAAPLAGVPDGVSRRELFTKLAAVGLAGLTLPIVQSINSPAAAQSATCLPSGFPCISSSQCCSGVCSGGFCL